MLKQQEYQENLLGAVQILIDSSIKGLQYDKTIICSVVKNDKAKQGEYTVTDGSINFSAYSNEAEYSVGDTVRVQIPQGDMSQDKYIQGKYIADKGTSAITQVSPLESILDISGSLVSNLSSGIIATGNNPNKVPRQIILKELVSVELNELNNNSNYANLKNNKIVDTFYIQASFKTLFSKYQIVSGEYGIRADFYDNNNTIKSLYLSSKDMFGDPYNFMIYSQQGQTYSLENIDTIKRIVFYLYQDDAFTYVTDSGIISKVPTFGDNNIVMKNLVAGFATDLSGIEDNTVKIFTPNQTYFSNDEILKDVVNDKILQLLWYNKNENHKYIGFSDGICDTNYDELEYIAEQKAISRLIPHLSNYRVPHDEKGLKLAADKEEFEPLLDKLYNLLSNDFYKTLNSYKARFKEILRALISDPKSNISNLETVIQSIKNYYTDCLYYGCFYNPRVDITDEETGDPIQPKIEDQPYLFPTYYACWDNLKTVYDDITEDFQNDSFLQSLKDEIESNATDYMGLYNSLKTKINVIIKEANEILASIELLLEDESKLLLYHYNSAVGYDEYFKDTDTYKNYTDPENDKDTSNRYCIYWYRYDPLEKLYNDKEYVKGDPFFGEKWIRCKEWTNIGLPYDGTNGKYYELTRFAGNTQVSVILESDKMQEERFRAVLFYNHVRYDSNVLIFNNTTELVSSTTEALTNYIKITHFSNSQDHYQSYDECNNLINASDTFLQRKLTVSYHVNDKLVDNERLKGAHICWYIPNNLTMLDCYDKDYDGKNATISDKPAGTSLTECGWNAKPGYKSIYYQMSEDEIEEDKLTFIYRIKSYYEYTNTQNTVLCRIITSDDTEYEAELPITFSSYGMSGTNYTLSIRPKEDQIVVMDDSPLKLGVYLYNYDNLPMDVPGLTVSVMGDNSIYTASWNAEQKEITVSKNKTELNPTSEQYFGIVSVKITIDNEDQDNKLLDLTGYYPLAYCQKNYFIKGPTVVTYDSAGSSDPKYNGSAYQLFDQKDKTEIIIDDCLIVGKDGLSKVEKQFLPTITETETKQFKLNPCAIYVENIVKDEKNIYSFPVVVKITTQNGDTFYQSLFIHQNRYGSPMLNAWDGSFEIDEEAGTIMSTMVGAGKKNNDNTFSGVLMGDITSSGMDSGSGIGLYGFHEGAQSFNFNVDGTAFLGKAGHGRIHFNGNTGTIQSASFSQLKGGAGMLIDLDDGYLEMRGAIGSMEDGYSVDSQSKIYLGVTERDNAYFSIHSKNGNPLIKIGTEEYFLQTDNFSDGTDAYKLEDITYEDKELYLRTKKAGTRINLQDGKITSYNFTIDAENDAGGKVFLSSDNNEDFPFYIKGKENEIFSVKWDGSIFATAGQIGRDASRGQIIINGMLDININDKEDGEPSSQTQGPYLYLGQLVDKEDETFSNRFHLQSLNFGIGRNDFFLGTSGLLMRDDQNNSDYGMRLTSSTLAIEGSPSDDRENDSDGNETDYSMYSLTTYDGNGITFRKKDQRGSNIFRDSGTNPPSIVGRIKMVGGIDSPKLNINGVNGITFSGEATFSNGVSLGNDVSIKDESADGFPVSANGGTISGAFSAVDERLKNLETELVQARLTLKTCEAGCYGCQNCEGSLQNCGACYQGQCNDSPESE